jgi:hypothetical protein
LQSLDRWILPKISVVSAEICVHLRHLRSFDQLAMRRARIKKDAGCPRQKKKNRRHGIMRCG